MKICIVALDIVPYFLDERSARYGGAEVQSAALARAFASRGAEVSFVVKNLPQNASLPFPAQSAYDSNHGVWGIRFFHPRLSGTYRALALADADIYYQHCAGMITGLTALFCRKKRRVFVFGAGSNTDFTFAELLIPGVRDKILYTLGLKLADGVIAQNQFQRDLCKKRYDKSARVIPMVIGMEDSDEISSGEKVLWVGALREVKGPERFLQLAQRVPEREFVLVGGPIESERAYSDKILEKAAGIPNLTCTGRIPHAEVIDLLRSAAILVNTSSVEGFPNVYLEAWKHGVPVVSLTDVDELIAGEGVGFLCSGMEDMEQKIKSLLEDPDQRTSMGKRARAMVSSKFSADVLSGEYMAYFEELLEKHHRHSGPEL